VASHKRLSDTLIKYFVFESSFGCDFSDKDLNNETVNQSCSSNISDESESNLFFIIIASICSTYYA
jgi:hypothetical protein